MERQVGCWGWRLQVTHAHSLRIQVVPSLRSYLQLGKLAQAAGEDRGYAASLLLGFDSGPATEKAIVSSCTHNMP
jgi:hypothetical protein